MANENWLPIEVYFPKNPNICVFNIGVSDGVQESVVYVNPTNIVSCTDLRHALLRIQGVADVTINRLNKVEVTKNSSFAWGEVLERIKKTIREYVG